MAKNLSQTLKSMGSKKSPKAASTAKKPVSKKK